MNPELSFEEFRTTRFLTGQVRKMGLKILPLKMKTGLLAELSGKHAGPTVAIRTDIDGLPIQEQTDLPFKSKQDDRMHACGHDMHMAVVLGTAWLLAEMREEICGAVRFIFQPGEEMPPGGARPMIANGALDNISTIFGLHVDPSLPTGKISLRDGATMASVYDFDLVIRGRGGHAARPQLSVDAIAAAAEVIESVQKIISREIDPVTPAAITFGRIEGGIARNVIADSVALAGTARTASDKWGKRIPVLIRKTIAGVCRARGATFEIKEIASYPVLKNDSRTNRLYARNYESLFGKGKITRTEQVLGGEDFACYLERVPGAMFFLGVMNKKIGANKPWHSPQFLADEDALPYGTSLLAACTLDYLENNAK